MADELIADGEEPQTAKLEDLTNEQLLDLALRGSEEAASILADRGYGHQQ